MNALLGRFLRGFWGPALVHAVLLLGAFHPLDQGWLAVPAWVVLFASMRLRRGAKSARQMFVAAFVFFLVGLWWTAPIMVGGWIFAAFWCAAWEALFARWLGGFFRKASPARLGQWLLLAPCAHLLFDMLRTTVFSGFPWFLTGYAGWRIPMLIGSADLLGVHGATLAILALAAALAELTVRSVGNAPHDEVDAATPARGAGRVLAVAGTIWIAFTAWTYLKPAPTLRPGPRVALLQANIPQKTKEDLLNSGGERWSRTRWVQTHVDLIEQARQENTGRPIDLVVWPETMFPERAILPLDTVRNAELIWKPLSSWADGASTLAGLMTFDPSTGRLANSSVLIDPRGRPLGRQDKRHLTPGGETLLFLDWLPEGLRGRFEAWLREWAGYVPNLAAGTSAQPLPVPLRGGGEARVGVVICYECLFPALSRDQALAGADFLLNSSNYGWFAGTPQMEQALALCAFRAAETRRALVAASNNGLSAVIGPDGRVLSKLSHDEIMTDVRGVLVADVPLAEGVTPFVFWGEYSAWLLGLLATIFGLTLVRPGRPS